MLKIAIVIPIFNGLSFTKNCLQNIYNSTWGILNNGFDYSVVITDDGSTDGTDDIVKKHLLQNNWMDLVRRPGQLDRNWYSLRTPCRLVCNTNLIDKL